MRDFIGALGQKSANRGVFITTSSFSEAAKSSIKNVHSAKIVLIDGDELAEFLVEHNVGVQPSETYIVKKVDLDYFADE